jgi:hypothetical protein
MPTDDVALWQEWLMARLEEKGLTPEVLRSRSGGAFGPIMIHQWVAGYRRPTADQAVRVAEILGVPAAEALGAAGFGQIASKITLGETPPN